MPGHASFSHYRRPVLHRGPLVEPPTERFMLACAGIRRAFEIPPDQLEDPMDYGTYAATFQTYIPAGLSHAALRSTRNPPMHSIAQAMVISEPSLSSEQTRHHKKSTNKKKKHVREMSTSASGLRRRLQLYDDASTSTSDDDRAGDNRHLFQNNHVRDDGYSCCTDSLQLQNNNNQLTHTCRRASPRQSCVSPAEVRRRLALKYPGLKKTPPCNPDPLADLVSTGGDTEETSAFVMNSSNNKSSEGIGGGGGIPIHVWDAGAGRATLEEHLAEQRAMMAGAWEERMRYLVEADYVKLLSRTADLSYGRMDTLLERTKRITGQ